MTGTRQDGARERRAWLAFLFCALLLRALVPAGFMIGASASGSPALIVCPDAAPQIAMHGGHHQKAPGKHRESPCPFGVLGAPALPPTPSVLAAAVPMVPPPAPAFVSRSIKASLAAPPPPSTGPPFISRS
jgi:hypothetical protein